MDKVRRFDNLVVSGEDMVIAGDLEITNMLMVNNVNLIVSGEIRFTGDEHSPFIIDGGDISCDSIAFTKFAANLKKKNGGDIFVHDSIFIENIKSFGGGNIICSNLYSSNIYSDGNIFVKDEADVFNVIANEFSANYCDSYAITAKRINIPNIESHGFPVREIA